MEQVKEYLSESIYEIRTGEKLLCFGDVHGDMRVFMAILRRILNPSIYVPLKAHVEECKEKMKSVNPVFVSNCFNLGNVFKDPGAHVVFHGDLVDSKRDFNANGKLHGYHFADVTIVYILYNLVTKEKEKAHVCIGNHEMMSFFDVSPHMREELDPQRKSSFFKLLKKFLKHCRPAHVFKSNGRYIGCCHGGFEQDFVESLVNPSALVKDRELRIRLQLTAIRHVYMMLLGNPYDASLLFQKDPSTYTDLYQNARQSEFPDWSRRNTQPRDKRNYWPSIDIQVVGHTILNEHHFTVRNLEGEHKKIFIDTGMSAAFRPEDDVQSIKYLMFETQGTTLHAVEVNESIENISGPVGVTLFQMKGQSFSRQLAFNPL